MGAPAVAAGFVETQLSGSLFGDELENRRSQLRAKLPIRRGVQPADVAALAVHIMTNTALTGATYESMAGSSSSSPEIIDVRGIGVLSLAVDSSTDFRLRIRG